MTQEPERWGGGPPSGSAYPPAADPAWAADPAPADPAPAARPLGAADTSQQDEPAAQPASGQQFAAQQVPVQQVSAQPSWGRPASAAPALGPSAGLPGHLSGLPATVPPPPAEGRWRPGRVDTVPGTGFGVVHPQIAPVTSGLSVGSLIAGVAAILVSFLVLCFGLAGADSTWGPWVAGAFTVLGVLVGAGGIGLGLAARRQIRNSGQTGRIRFTGRGAAVAGIACGATGLGIALVSLVLVLVIHLV